MTMSRSTQARNWSYSRTFSAAEMDGVAAQRAAIDIATTAWEESAVASGFRIRRGIQPTESLAPMWLDADGNWTDVNPDRPAEGFKVTIVGPTG